MPTGFKIKLRTFWLILERIAKFFVGESPPLRTQVYTDSSGSVFIQTQTKENQINRPGLSLLGTTFHIPLDRSGNTQNPTQRL